MKIPFVSGTHMMTPTSCAISKTEEVTCPTLQIIDSPLELRSETVVNQTLFAGLRILIIFIISVSTIQREEDHSWMLLTFVIVMVVICHTLMRGTAVILCWGTSGIGSTMVLTMDSVTRADLPGGVRGSGGFPATSVSTLPVRDGDCFPLQYPPGLILYPVTFLMTHWSLTMMFWLITLWILIHHSLQTGEDSKVEDASIITEDHFIPIHFSV